MNITSHLETTRRSHEQLASERKTPSTMAKTKTKKSTLDYITKREKISVHGKILQAVIAAEAITADIEKTRKAIADISAAQGRLSRQLSDLFGFLGTCWRLGDDANATELGDRDSDRNPPTSGTPGDNDPSRTWTGRQALPGAKDLDRGKSDRASVDRSESAGGVPLGIELPPRIKKHIPGISELRDNLFERCTDHYYWDANYFELLAAHHAVSGMKLAALVAGREFIWEERNFPEQKAGITQWRRVFEFRPKK